MTERDGGRDFSAHVRELTSKTLSSHYCSQTSHDEIFLGLNFQEFELTLLLEVSPNISQTTPGPYT